MYILTPEGHEKINCAYLKLKSEYDSVIQDALEVCDYSNKEEDYEYVSSDDDIKIGKLNSYKEILSNCKILDNSEKSNDKVLFGSYVKVLDTETEKEYIYRIVGLPESDVENGFISLKSPFGASLLDCAVDDVINRQDGKEFEIIEISNSPFY